MPRLFAPRFFGDPVLLSCITAGHRIHAFSGDPITAIMILQQALADLGYAVSVDGDFGDETGNAVVAYKQSKGLFPDDAVVGEGTMTALDQDFAHELFDGKASELVGTPFYPGSRVADRVDNNLGFAWCQHENGIVVELAGSRAFALPGPFGATWLDMGGIDSFLGAPITDAFDLGYGRSGQEFVNGALVLNGDSTFALPRDVWDASNGGFDLGVPTSAPIEYPDATVTYHDKGVVMSVANSAPQPLPDAVFDLWNGQLTAGMPLGAPTALGFASGSDIIFPFQLGSIVLSNLGAADVAAPIGGNLQRFFIPENTAQLLAGPSLATGATAIIRGSNALRAMRNDIAAAHGPNDFIYILSWHCNSDLELVPGDPASTLKQLLTASVLGGAQVRAMLWAADPTLSTPLALTPIWPAWEIARHAVITATRNRAFNEPTVNFINGLAASGDAVAILDNRHLRYGSHHQKVVVVKAGDKLVGYVGGIEANDDRLHADPLTKGSPLFDLAVRVEDAGAWWILNTFTARWNAHPAQSGLPLRGNTMAHPPVGGPLTVQVTHTYGRDMPFAGKTIRTAAAAASNAIRQARQFVYIEDQYCVGSPQMRSAVLDFLSSQPAGVVIFMLAAEDSVGDLPDMAYRRRQFFQTFVPAYTPRVFIFERLGQGSPIGPEAYVHSKLILVDDEAALVGSMNSNRRSWFHDSEVFITIVDNGGAGTPAAPGWVRSFRAALWGDHLGVAPASVLDPLAGMALWTGALGSALPSATCRPYNVFTVPVRPNLYGYPAPDPVLDLYWDTFADPA
jgi:hypothetical protein